MAGDDSSCLACLSNKGVVAMHADVLVSTAWRSGETPPVGAPRPHLTLLPSASGGQPPVYRWRQGRHTVTLTRNDGSWVVQLTTTGRLFGPVETIYEGRHVDERYACWDVMARVIKTTRDEDEGLKAGREAAAWVAATFDRSTLTHA